MVIAIIILYVLIVMLYVTDFFEAKTHVNIYRELDYRIRSLNRRIEDLERNKGIQYD